MTDNLLPCPFCGCAPARTVRGNVAHGGDCILKIVCSVEDWNTRALTRQAQVSDDELNKRLCDLHARVLRCFEGATGERPPRRPRSFTPEWGDTDTLLDAAVALDRARSIQVSDDAVVEALKRAMARLHHIGDHDQELMEFASRALSATNSEAVSEEWRPIGTVPKHGRRIYTLDCDGRAGISYANPELARSIFVAWWPLPEHGRDVLAKLGSRAP